MTIKSPIIETLEARITELERRMDLTGPPVEPPVEPPVGEHSWLGTWMTGREALGGTFPQMYLAWETWLGGGTRIITPYVHAKMQFGGGGYTKAINIIENDWPGWFGTDLADGMHTLAIIMDITPVNRASGPDFAGHVAGTYDANLQRIAQGLIDIGHSHACLRLWHEADLSPNFITWTFTGGNATAYKDAWQHVHDIMMGVAGANFRWQYSINGPAGAGDQEGGVDLIDLGYPGSDFVDSVSVGHYDRSQYKVCDNGFGPAQTKLDFVRSFAIDKGIKFDIAEWGLRHTDAVSPGSNGCGDDHDFIQASYEYFNGLPATLRGYMLYFNDWDFSRIDDITPAGGQFFDQYPKSREKFLALLGVP